ncbi:sialidase family protein [Marinilabiliaceae bacterium ANBcel2]|nr:sialidase family protein [Marinilabiliaceae bacterium ANBcel2]
MKRLFYLVIISVFALGLNSCATEATGVSGGDIVQKKVPLFLERDNDNLFQISFEIEREEAPLSLEALTVKLKKGSDYDVLSSLSAHYLLKEGDEDNDPEYQYFGETSTTGRSLKINGDYTLDAGEHTFIFNAKANSNVDLVNSFVIEKIEATLSNGYYIVDNNDPYSYRPAKVLRAAGQDNCHTYRIPGLTTTSEGTLIAVYDNRYNNSKDLQEDIDVGMSRSTDGGQTWEPMKVIMDMGEWGGHPPRRNGIGDPAVLYDPNTNTLWAAALWISGMSPDKMLWWHSQPGMSPEETGQFVLVKSTDDGKTWSDPINITDQIKDPEWQLMFMGPGRGITMDDGTIVFAAQFKEDIGEKAIDGGDYVSHSTIVYSKDGGETWEIGTGAKPNTTEAQVVQLDDGSLMLNMRDDINRIEKGEGNGRAVAITNDMGKTWTTHPSSNSALREPNCMASLLDHYTVIDGEEQQVLLFSNPDSKTARVDMTIKVSIDGGHTWPKENQVLLNQNHGFGYSCMSMVDDNSVGIVYEGVRELYFQKVLIDELLSQ